MQIKTLSTPAVRTAIERANELVYRRNWITCDCLMTHWGRMHHEPIVFAFRDTTIRWLVATAAILWLAI